MLEGVQKGFGPGAGGRTCFTAAGILYRYSIPVSIQKAFHQSSDLLLSESEINLWSRIV